MGYFEPLRDTENDDSCISSRNPLWFLPISAAEDCGEVALESRGEGALLVAGGSKADPPSTDGVGVGADEGFFGVPVLGSELKEKTHKDSMKRVKTVGKRKGKREWKESENGRKANVHKKKKKIRKRKTPRIQTQIGK